MYSASQMREFSETTANSLNEDCETSEISKGLIHEDDFKLFVEILSNDGLAIIDETETTYIAGYGI